MAKKRKQYTGEEKPAILRRHHLEGVPVSDICDEHELQATVFCPQSTGKIERRHRSFKSECIRPTTPLSLQAAQRLARKSVAVHNTELLHNAIGYIGPRAS